MAYYERPGTPIRIQHGSHYPSWPAPSDPPENAGHIYMEKETGRKPFDMKILLYVVVAMAFITAVVFCHFQQLQVRMDYMEKQTEYELLQSENIRLQSVIAGKTSNKNVQEYAESVLGMQKINPSQIEYVQIQTEDVVKIPEEEDNFFVRVRTWFRSLVEYFRG